MSMCEWLWLFMCQCGHSSWGVVGHSLLSVGEWLWLFEHHCGHSLCGQHPGVRCDAPCHGWGVVGAHHQLFVGSCWVVIVGGCGMLMGGCGCGGCGPWLCCVVAISWSLWHLSPLAFVFVTVGDHCGQLSSFIIIAMGGHCWMCVFLVVVRERKAMSCMITKQRLFVMHHK